MKQSTFDYEKMMNGTEYIIKEYELHCLMQSGKL